MRPRKVRDIESVLSHKGFERSPQKQHHKFFFLAVNGKKTHIFTYLSHGETEYNSSLMGKIKYQLKFKSNEKAEEFFDCPFTKDDYIKMLITEGNAGCVNLLNIR